MDVTDGSDLIADRSGELESGLKPANWEAVKQRV